MVDILPKTENHNSCTNCNLILHLSDLPIQAITQCIAMGPNTLVSSIFLIFLVISNLLWPFSHTPLLMKVCGKLFLLTACVSIYFSPKIKCYSKRRTAPLYTFNCIYINRISIFSTPAFVIGFVLQDILKSFFLIFYSF